MRSRDLKRCAGLRRSRTAPALASFHAIVLRAGDGLGDAEPTPGTRDRSGRKQDQMQGRYAPMKVSEPEQRSQGTLAAILHPAECQRLNSPSPVHSAIV